MIRTTVETPDPLEPDDIADREKTIEISVQTRQKLAELMDQLDETIVVLRTEVEHAKLRRGES